MNFSTSSGSACLTRRGSAESPGAHGLYSKGLEEGQLLKIVVDG